MIRAIKKVLTILEAGSMGGKARKKALTPERRSEIARMGAAVTNRRYLDRKEGYRSWRDGQEEKKNAR